jgi:hypothetical protein
MRSGIRTCILANVLLLVSSGGSVPFGNLAGPAPADQHKGRDGENKNTEKKDVGVRSGRDTNEDDGYDEGGPPGAASAPPSSGGRGREGSGLTRGPCFRRVTPGGVTLRWRARTPAGSRVRYGTVPGPLDVRGEAPGESREHEVPLPDLRRHARHDHPIGESDPRVSASGRSAR